MSLFRPYNSFTYNGLRPLASCPSPITVGTPKTLMATGEGGVTPYTYNWTIIKPGGATETRSVQSFSYIFDMVGSYTIRLTIRDSCSTPQNSVPSECTIVVENAPVVCPNLSASLACPTGSPYAPGDTVSFVVSISTGTLPYTLTLNKNNVPDGSYSTSSNSYTIPYVVSSQDSGSLNFNVTVVDTCATGSKQVTTNTCTVSIGSPCVQPACGYYASQ